MDYIYIEKLIVRGKHGVLERERKVEQEFEVSLKLGVGDTSRAAQSGHLKDAVDYMPIKDEIVRIIENNTFYLIETLADTIATSVLKDERIQTLELTIKKPEVWEEGMPGLTIVRSR